MLCNLFPTIIRQISSRPWRKRTLAKRLKAYLRDPPPAKAPAPAAAKAWRWSEARPPAAQAQPSSTNQPIFEKYKCVNFPMFAECLGEGAVKVCQFSTDFSGALARKVSKIWKIDTLYLFENRLVCRLTSRITVISLKKLRTIALSACPPLRF